MKIIGPTFGEELVAAGLKGVSVAFTAQGDLILADPNLTADQKANIQKVYDAHKSGAPTSAQVDRVRNERLDAGFADPVTAKTFQCDARSRGFLTALGASAGILMSLSSPPTYELIASDNTTLTLTAADTFALINNRIMAWVTQTIIYSRSLKDQILAGGTPDLTQGWP